MYPFKKPLPSDSPENKKLRGFNNDECTFLLAPDGLDLTDEKSAPFFYVCSFRC